MGGGKKKREKREEERGTVRKEEGKCKKDSEREWQSLEDSGKELMRG